MSIKGFFEQLNIFFQCKKYRLPIWRCPQFLFVVMGLAIMATAIVTYIVGTRYVVDHNAVALIDLTLTVVLFVITFSIIKSMEGLAEANQLKSEFISVVSHQLRSPVSNLKWANEILMSDRLDGAEEKQKEYLKILKENIVRMEELVSDLLMVARIEQGTLPLQKTEFSFEDLIKDVIPKFKVYAEASNIEIKLEAQTPLPMAFADSSQVKSVIENLLDNAIRYTKNGRKVEINIGKSGGELLFAIKDTGVGIPEEDQRHIFQKFFRSKNILRHQTEGSGLGLYIAKSIIEKMKGKIGFKSREGVGSTFWFTLPIKK